MKSPDLHGRYFTEETDLDLFEQLFKHKQNATFLREVEQLKKVRNYFKI